MLDATLPSKLRFRLLGEAKLATGDSATDGFRVSTQKGMALLVYLAMNAGRAISRAVLADLLWGDRVDAQARQNLRQCLLTLRRDLEPTMSGVLLTDDHAIALRADAIEVDALTFAQAANAIDFAQRRLCLTLPWGPFLHNFHTGADAFDQWAAAERNRLDALATRTFAELAERLDAAGDGEGAILALERLVAIDPAEEDRYRRLLSVEARYRGADAALARAKTLVFELQHALDADPEPATLALIETIRRSATTEFKAEDIARPPTAALPTADDRLRAIPASDTDAGEGEFSPVVAAPPDKVSSIGAWMSPRQPGFRRAAAAAGIAFLVVAGGAFGLMHGRQSPQTTTTADRPAPQNPSWESPRLPSRPMADASTGRAGGIVAIAVLPFTISGEAGEPSTIFAEIITDDLTNTLSRMGGFRVISRQTAKSFRGQHLDAAAVGAELGVRYLLTGSAEVRGNQLRVNVELIDAGSRLRVWSGRFERTGADRNAIQDEIVKGLGRELQIEVTQVEGGRTSDEPDVHELIFKGWSAMADAAATGLAALGQAELYFTQALARDPDNPRAQTGLGAYHVNMAAQLFAADPAPHLAKGEALLRDVIDRYPNMDGPHQFMGLLYIASGRRSEAGPWFERAIELNPSQAPSYAQLGRVLAGQGRPEEGLEHILYAIRLSPRDHGMPYWLGFAGFAELEAKNYAKAIEYLERALVLNPGQPRTSLTLVAAHALAGNMREARMTLEQLQNRLPHLTHEKLIERFFGTRAKSAPPQLSEGLRLAMVPPADPWASPRLPSRPSTAVSAGSSLTPIAVLPFTTYGDTAGAMQLTADMITDDLINTLSRVPGLRVISRQTMRSYQGQAIDVAAIGAELGVRYVLEGSMRMRDAKLRVNVELIDPTTRSSVWSGRIEREGADHHGVQDEIVGRLARELNFEVFRAEGERRMGNSTVSSLVYKGWAANYAAGTSGLDALKQAETYFSQALERDPQNLSAQVGLAAYHVNVGAQRLVAEPGPHLDKAHDLLRDAIRRSAGNSGAYYYLGIVHSAHANLQDAVDSFERALELNPSHAAAYAQIGHALARMGRTSEGLEHIHYALRLSPRDPVRSYWLQFAGNAEVARGAYQQAIENFRRSATLNPRYPRNFAGLAAAHALSGNIAEARVYADKLKQTAPHLTADQLIERFAGTKGPRPSRLAEGLRLALTPSL